MTRLSRIFTATAIAALASCTKMTILEPCPELSEAEMKETILGSWELKAIGHNLEPTVYKAMHVVPEDTLRSAISHIEYGNDGNGYLITFHFKDEVRIEQTTYDGDDRSCIEVTTDMFTMQSSSTSSFPLNFKYNDNGEEIFRSAVYKDSDGKATTYYFNYNIGYYGRDLIAKFEIDWFVLESDHLFYEFARK